jgi:predicted site-specific integrase-resolvase
LLLRTNEVVKKYNITAVSLREWEAKGLLKPYRTPGQHRRYSDESIKELLHIENKGGVLKVGIYARVSTKKQEENLNRQVARLKNYCKEKCYGNILEFIEVASGINDKRRQFHKMIDAIIKKDINIIVVEYKDRLSRFGIGIITHFIEGLNCKLEVIEEKATKEENEDLVNDVLALITSFSARLYGKRGGRKKLQKELEI